MMCGGHTAPREVTAEEVAHANNHRADAEAQHGAFTVWEVRSVTSQVVAGTNLTFLIAVGREKDLTLRVFIPLPHTGNPTQMSVCEF